MRKVIVLSLCLLLLVACQGGSSQEQQIDPRVRLDADKTYTVEYWDVEPPGVMDPRGEYRGKVEELVLDFCNEHPGIQVNMRWLSWTEAQQELEQALKKGTPPDLWGDWAGIAYYHGLQIPAEIWLEDEELLTPAGAKAARQGGQTWAWPRWIWPRGLLALHSQWDELDVVTAQWDWRELAECLEETDFYLQINDWNGEFSTQALQAATGYGYGQWGGQELHEVFAALELLRQEGLIDQSTEYQEITQGTNMLGGFAPALVTWMAENMDQEEVVLLPVPGISGGNTFVPCSASNLIQFRQEEYKGDDHSKATALVAQHLATNQGAVAELLWAAPAWEQANWTPDLPPWYCTFLEETMERGVPLYSLSSKGRARENEFRDKINAVLADFWAGKADAQDVAYRLEKLQ